MKSKILVLIGLFSTSIAIAQKPVASIPFEQFGDHIFIKLSVNSSAGLDYIFDTGDGLTVLNINKVGELGMASGTDAETTSAEGTIKGKLVKHNEISIAGAPLHNVAIYETSLNHLEMSIGRNIDGIIGYDILKNYVVNINYDDMTFNLYAPKGYNYSGGGTSFDIKLTSYIPHVKGKVKLVNGETLEGEFFVDTGAKATVDFNTPFVENNNLASKIGDSYIYLVAGLGKREYEHHRGKAASFEVGGYTFSDIPVGLSHAKSGIQNHKKISGILGNGLLDKFNITYDYHSKKMYWEKNSKYDEVFPVNASGMELQLSKDKSAVLIHKVFKGSAAEGAGLTVQSELEQVNGKNASEIGLAELRSIFSKSGNKVAIVVDGKAIDLQLKAML